MLQSVNLLLAAIIAFCAFPAPSQAAITPSNPSEFWYEQITHQGTSSYNANPSSYQIYRNVKDFGAKGDGVTDDTAAINAAFSTGSRCSDISCGGSSTLTPAVVYFPSGTYIVSSSLFPEYMTQIIGNPLNMPTIKATSGFSGGYIVDADPYLAGGAQTYGSTNNFYKVIQNLKFDMTAWPASSANSAIHWPVAQATTLQNLVFNMNPGSQAVGVFIENGSGGFMSDLTFNGGNIGLDVGNQQFTSRNIVFNGVTTAINQIWDWAWTYTDLSINNCGVGINLAVAPGNNQSVGSIAILDSTFTNTPIGIKTSTSDSSEPPTSGTLYLENVDFTSTPIAVSDFNGNKILAGNAQIASWGQGHLYSGTSNQFEFVQESFSAPARVSSLLGSGNKYFSLSAPQYQQYSSSQFASVKSGGAKGDGKTDDTQAIQNVINANAGSKIIFFDAGSYVVSNTITVPANAWIIGEAWSTIMATGSKFGNAASPIPVFRVGASGGATGNVQISNMIFSNIGPIPGATLIEWNIKDSTKSSGLWNVHARIGGSQGSNQLSCSTNTGSYTPSTSCYGSFLMLHVTSTANIYLENVWLWNADHNLDGDHAQVSIFSGRGLLLEGTGPSLLYGTAVEHNVFYQYQLNGAQNVALFMIQTETPYFQANPPAPAPYTAQSSYNDPTFSNCNGNAQCEKAWGARFVDVSNVWVYGAGLYSFFDNYGQACIATDNCQEFIYELDSVSNVYTYNLNTIASQSMVDQNGNSVVSASPNTNVYPWTIVAYFLNSATSAISQALATRNRAASNVGQGFGVPDWVCNTSGYSNCTTS